MRFAVVAPNVGAYGDARTVAGLAREAEAAGWDGFFVWDTIEYDHQPVCDVWLTLAVVATATERVRLGPLVLSMARRRPWKVAREALTLDHISGGRLTLGVGAGYEEEGFTRFGEPADPRRKAERLDEGLAIVNGLLSGEPFSYAGTHYTVRETTFLPRPVNGTIPVWVAANRPLETVGPLRRAARQDGILGGIRRADVGEVRARIAGYRGAAGLADAPFDVVVSVFDPDQPVPTPADVEDCEAAGVTWLRYEVGPLFGTVDSIERARRLISRGPPR